MKRFIFVIIGIIVLIWVINMLSSSYSPQQEEEEIIPEQPTLVFNGEYCYVEKQKSGFDFAEEDDFDYKFLRFTAQDNTITDGILETYPFATDSSRGTIEGALVSADDNVVSIDMLYHWSAEGMTGTSEERLELIDDFARIGYGAYVLSDDGVYRYGPEGIMGWWEIPKVSCATYDDLYAEYRTR